MNFHPRKILIVCAVCLSVIPQTAYNVAQACAPAPPRNKAVEIADESAIIVWDPATKTQHFIRRASFKSDARDFGFLVPTPTKPDLAEAGDKAFVELARITAPRIVTRPRETSSPGCGCSETAPVDRSFPPAVQVLEEKRVAGYDAVVLQADDAEALSKWLTDHGYEFSPSLKDWAAVYIKMGWKITAFKIAKDAVEAPGVATSAVRMTFHTEQPYFPYREPKDQFPPQPGAKTSRLLRVFFVTNFRVEGALGGAAASWATVAAAKPIEDADREKITQILKLPAEIPSGPWWVTEFEDHSSPRPGTDDVIFRRSDAQTPIERPSRIQYTSNNATGYLMVAAMGLCIVAPSVLSRLKRRVSRK